MTQEQIDAMILESSDLLINRKSWANLSSRQYEVFCWLLPDPSFSDVQHYWIGQWFLEVESQEQVDEINSIINGRINIAPLVSQDGTLYLRADLLSDAINDGPLSGIMHILENMLMEFKYNIIWSQE